MTTDPTTTTTTRNARSTARKDGDTFGVVFVSQWFEDYGHERPTAAVAAADVLDACEWMFELQQGVDGRSIAICSGCGDAMMAGQHAHDMGAAICVGCGCSTTLDGLKTDRGSKLWPQLPSMSKGDVLLVQRAGDEVPTWWYCNSCGWCEMTAADVRAWMAAGRDGGRAFPRWASWRDGAAAAPAESRPGARAEALRAIADAVASLDAAGAAVRGD